MYVVRHEGKKIHRKGKYCSEVPILGRADSVLNANCTSYNTASSGCNLSFLYFLIISAILLYSNYHINYSN